MTFQKFLERYNGVPVDFDGAYGYQCMDLMHQYIVDVLGLTDKRILAAPTAKDVYLNYPNIFGSQYFDKIDNTPTNVSDEGCIVFWGTKIGSAGHVAIFIEGDVNKFRSFDQNFPVGSLPHVQEHTYKGVLGWLKFKNNLPNEDLLKQRADAFVAVAERLNKPVDKDTVLADIEMLLKQEEIIRKKDETINLQVQQLQELTKKASDLQKTADTLSSDNQRLLGSLQELTQDAEKQSKEIAELQRQLEEVKNYHLIETASATDLINEIVKRLFKRRG